MLHYYRPASMSHFHTLHRNVSDKMIIYVYKNDNLRLLFMLLSIICALRKEAGPPSATLVSSTQRTICKQQVPGVAIRLQPIVAVRRRSCSVYNICGVMPRRTCKRFEIRDATYKLKLRVSNIRTYSVIVTRVSPRESVWGDVNLATESTMPNSC